ncbi:GAF domain-containing protein [Aetokthonos hydrillicola Thurmond2011]|jgi:twitching motility protein PilJ|uniref:GAF domain-containing protein n=2 Tax=Aetokthonos TaxID=1550243 RepID=A0AAP5ICS0_9CYAN|nr:GAF domain-containing protein [Aetokthonos hydrillicola]MBW4588838.1 GAF domain-containing protein [Aetokthonos hydrillicola CCALA 1050]MDR9897298.1 GAF domain-containing protein [Aetokthonos hydrillicola Thurmond2011]
MTQPSSQKQSRKRDIEKSTINNSLDDPTRLQGFPLQKQQQRKRWSLKAKTIAWALAVSMLPVLTVGAFTYLLGNQITKRIPQDRQDRLLGSIELAETQALQRHLLIVLMGTGLTAVLAGAIAAFVANRAIRPILNAAAISTSMVNRLHREIVGTTAPVISKDELVVLETNIGLIKEKLLGLLYKQEVETERSQVLMDITRRIQESRNEENVLITTVEEVRKALKIDRVTIFRFNPEGDGTFVAESVGSGLQKTLWTTISDPGFVRGYIEKCQKGGVLAINDVYQANLSDSQVELLERFSVKSYVVAPIFKDEELFGLLIGHQCSRFRFWQQYEIDLFAQIAGTQIGLALNYAKRLEQVDSKIDQAQVFISITRRIRESLNEEDVLKATVEEVRKALIADRVVIYGFDSNWYGTVVAEAVLPGFPKTLRADIKDPCFAEGYIEKYQAGRVQAINNIYEAGLTACHIDQLKPFGIKANLVAPILKDDQLFGLLIAHQCSKPRNWQQSEIDLFSQVATQVGFALDHARLLQRTDAKGLQTEMFVEITRQIWSSRNEEELLKATVEKVRKTLNTDRVIVYGFDRDWYGSVIAEAVVPGFPKTLRANIKDPCFAEGYVEKYQAGRVQAINNIYKANLTDCHISQLEAYGVKANLVAPIVKDNQLFGLLIAHNCSGPREWEQFEIDLFTQIAMQMGFALDHARLQKQVQQAYESAEATFIQQRQQQALQHQLSELLRSCETVVQTLSTEVAFNHMESVTSTYNQIQTIVDLARAMVTSVQQVELQEQDLSLTVQDENESLTQVLNSISTIEETVIDASSKLKGLDQPSQKLSELVNLISNVVSQIKLQAMHTGLEASRSGEAGQKFALIAEKVLSLVQQLDLGIVEIKPIVTQMQVQTNEVITAIESGAEQVKTGTELVKETQRKFEEMITKSEQIKILMTEVAQAAAVQVQTSTYANESIHEVAGIASQTSKHALAVADSLADLMTLIQDLQEDVN